MELTPKEKQSIKVLNQIAEYDGIITDSQDMIILLNSVISRHIAKRRQHLVRIDENCYPIKVKYTKEIK